MNREDQQLRDEIALREASLGDAKREFESGELTKERYEAIVSREETAIVLASDKIGSLVAPAPKVPVRRIRKKRWLVVAITAFSLALAGILWSALAPRQQGSSITGSVQLGHNAKIQQLLGEAEADVANGQYATALDAYSRVLAIDAKNVTALTQSGWLDFSAGTASKNAELVNKGSRLVSDAYVLAPNNPATVLYSAIIASSHGESKISTQLFKQFLALKPSAGQLAVATPFLKQLGITP